VAPPAPAPRPPLAISEAGRLPHGGNESAGACRFCRQWQLESGVSIVNGAVSGEMTSSSTATAGCWLRGSCSPCRNGRLAGLDIMAVRQNG